jgi:hypothetical protein
MRYDASMQLNLVVCLLHELLPGLDREDGSVLHVMHLLNCISHEVVPDYRQHLDSVMQICESEQKTLLGWLLSVALSDISGLKHRRVCQK